MTLTMTEHTLSLLPVAGVRIGVASAAIKQSVRPDLTLFQYPEDSSVAAVFTRNRFCAAPVTVAKSHLETTATRYWVINSGNANAGTGKQGLRDALDVCGALAYLDGAIAATGVLPFSTGVIGQSLPVKKIEAALPQALNTLSENGWAAAAQAIMTTDTVPKGCSRKVSLAGGEITITGIAKGAGMIRPDMATMLGFIATDARVDPGYLQACLNTAVERSFNRITIDGDTSTNDACVIVATGRGMTNEIPQGSDDAQRFQEALTEVCEHLAVSIVRDGEGATKLITIQVENGGSQSECLQVAYTVAHSPLVKTAFFASDANWGRILAAVGRAGIDDLNLEAVEIYLGDVCIVREGGRAEDYREEAGMRVMAETEITVRVLLGRGNCTERVWTCDFSYDYVRINAEYRT